MKQQMARMKKANRALIGREFRVLVDEVQRGRCAVARGPMDAPEIDNVIIIERPRGLKPGGFCDVRITGTENCELTAEKIR